MSSRALIFSYSWMFLVTETFRGNQHLYQMTLTLEFGYFMEYFNLGNNIWLVSAKSLSNIAHEHFLWQDLNFYVSLWSWPSLKLAIIGGIYVPQTHLVFALFL